MSVVLTRTDLTSFAKKRDALMKSYDQAGAPMINRWKQAWIKDLSPLPYLAKVLSLPASGRKHLVVQCVSKFVGLNLSIAVADMERLFAHHAASSVDTCYTIVSQPNRVELQFVELTRSREVVSGVVVITTGA